MAKKYQQPEKEFDERVIEIRRVATVVKGGRRFSFRVTAMKKARQNMHRVAAFKTTIPYEVMGKTGGARVMLKPASLGTGVIAGGGVRAVLEAAGISDILTKSLGSDNTLNVVQATMDALDQLKSPQQAAAERGLPVERVVPFWD